MIANKFFCDKQACCLFGTPHEKTFTTGKKVFCRKKMIIVPKSGETSFKIFYLVFFYSLYFFEIHPKAKIWLCFLCYQPNNLSVFYVSDFNLHFLNPFYIKKIRGQKRGDIFIALLVYVCEPCCQICFFKWWWWW